MLRKVYQLFKETQILYTSFRYSLNNLSTTGSEIEWTNQLANELHKPLRHNFPKRYIFVQNVDDI